MSPADILGFPEPEPEVPTADPDDLSQVWMALGEIGEEYERLSAERDELLSIIRIARPLLADVTQRRAGSLRLALLARMDKAMGGGK